MQTTELIEKKRTGLTHKGRPVYEVTRRYCKNGWKHKTATITDLCTVYTNENGKECFKKVYSCPST